MVWIPWFFFDIVLENNLPFCEFSFFLEYLELHFWEQICGLSLEFLRHQKIWMKYLFIFRTLEIFIGNVLKSRKNPEVNRKSCNSLVYNTWTPFQNFWNFTKFFEFHVNFSTFLKISVESKCKSFKILYVSITNFSDNL